MKVSDGCHCGVNMIKASRTGLVRQPKADKIVQVVSRSTQD